MKLDEDYTSIVYLEPRLKTFKTLNSFTNIIQDECRAIGLLTVKDKEYYVVLNDADVPVFINKKEEITGEELDRVKEWLDAKRELRESKAEAERLEKSIREMEENF